MMKSWNAFKKYATSLNWKWTHWYLVFTCMYEETNINFGARPVGQPSSFIAKFSWSDCSYFVNFLYAHFTWGCWGWNLQFWYLVWILHCSKILSLLFVFIIIFRFILFYVKHISHPPHLLSAILRFSFLRFLGYILREKYCVAPHQSTPTSDIQKNCLII